MLPIFKVVVVVVVVVAGVVEVVVDRPFGPFPAKLGNYFFFHSFTYLEDGKINRVLLVPPQPPTTTTTLPQWNEDDCYRTEKKVGWIFRRSGVVIGVWAARSVVLVEW